jgi:hypothetical protein
VAEDTKKRIVHRAENTLGLLVGRKVQLVVDRADGEIKFLENVVWQVERPVLENIHLARLEQRDAAELRIQALDLLDLLRQAFRV